MPNTFEYATWLSMECLDLLETKRSVSQFFNTDYNKEFKKAYAVGDSVNVPYPQQFTVTNGLPYVPQAINRRHASITFDEPFHIGFEWDSAEAYLRAPRGRAKVSKEILEPAMSQLANEIDMRCAAYAANNTATMTGQALGTNPSTYDLTSAISRQLMQELGCPDTGDRAIIVPPAVMRAVKTANLAVTNPAVDISKQFRKGIVGQTDGFEWYESMTLKRHTTGVWAGAVTVTTAPVDGATTLAVTCTTGDTFKKGEKIRIALVYPVHPQTRQRFGTTTKDFTITADAVGVSSAATLSISPAFYGPGSQYQNVDALPVAGQALTGWTGTANMTSAHTGQIGLALHRNAFALVGAELEEPKDSSVELVSQKRDPDSGIAVRFIRAWDTRASKFINRFDCMVGFGTFYNDSCAVVIPCA
jgi:hypothetical protein